jgi:hypothetical protein
MVPHFRVRVHASHERQSCRGGTGGRRENGGVSSSRTRNHPPPYTASSRHVAVACVAPSTHRCQLAPGKTPCATYAAMLSAPSASSARPHSYSVPPVCTHPVSDVSHANTNW